MGHCTCGLEDTCLTLETIDAESRLWVHIIVFRFYFDLNLVGGDDMNRTPVF